MTSENPATGGDALPPPEDKTGLIATCHCGRVQIEMPSKPPKINECHCTVCYKYGALWGYFQRPTVTVTTSDGATVVPYIRADKDACCSFNRCSHCGCMTHWWGVGKYTGPEHHMGVNCRLLPIEALEGIPRSVSPGPD
ncbi:hypothetical protein GQ53DRAFT_740942 [Thozetella sp. PMI_491]|nr:hypothetical protein GQ53DRAFT_740942 [Thozetella sp. PMI_491]